MNKNLKIIYGTSVIVAFGILLSVLVPSVKPVSTPIASGDCEWNHYNGVESNYLDNGSKEYWICCKHHETVFEKPEIGTIKDIGTPSDEFVKSLNPTDDRYGEIKKTDHVVAIKVNSVLPNVGSHTFATREQIKGLQSISFDAKWENATNISWIGFGHNSDIATADIYTNIKNYSCDVDGQWHSKTITFDGKDEYVYFCAAYKEFNDDATMVLRNIKITCSDGTVLEELANGIGNIFRSYYNPDFPELSAPSLSYETRGVDGENIDMAMKLEVNKLSADTGKLNIVSNLSYQGISKITIEYKATGGKKGGYSAWSRFAIADNPDSCDIYSVFSKPAADFSPEYDGEWHVAELSINGDGYLFFGAAIHEFLDETTFYFKSLKISYYWNNCFATESFNHDCMLFRSSSSVRGEAWTTVAV